MRSFVVNAPDFQRGALDGAGRHPCVVLTSAPRATDASHSYDFRPEPPARATQFRTLPADLLRTPSSTPIVNPSPTPSSLTPPDPASSETSSKSTQGSDGAEDRRVGPPLAVSEALFAELADLARSQDCELLHAGRKGTTLQLVLDHPDGVTVDHCASVSRDAAAILDAHDYGAERYILEVTSPGLDRTFYTVGDYRRFTGRLVRVTHRTGGNKATVTGRLESFDSDRGTLTLQTERDPVEISLDDILTTRLEIDI